MRNMSFPLTTAQVGARTKTVTRRFGWWFLRPGDCVQPVVKSRGLHKGDALQPIGGPIRVLSCRAEFLDDITQEDCSREGFPAYTPGGFISMLCRQYGCVAHSLMNRIEFEYLEDTP